MNSERLKVGIVGGGAVSELMHLPVLAKLPSVQIYALVDRDRERAKAMAGKFCLARYYTDHEDLFGEVDVALIALPNSLHAKLTIEFLQQNIHVLCEKPMAISIEECRSMITASKKSTAKLMIGHNKRFMSNVILGKKIIDNGGLGGITAYNCEVGAEFRWPTQTGFYFKKDEAGGGVLIDMGVHIIDLMLWIFGEVESVSYQAKDVLGKGVEDNVTVSLTHKNAVRGTITLSRTELLDNNMLIKGNSGWAKMNIFDTTFFEYQSTKSKISSGFGQLHVKTTANNAYRDQFAHFVSCIKSDSEPLISGIEGMRVIEIVEECYKQA